MDSIHVDTTKLEKATAIRKHGQLQKLTNLFRVIEICIILITLSEFSSQLPTCIESVMKSSSEYFKCFSIIISSPRFVFLIGNAIIITLFTVSGHFTSKDSSQNNSVLDVFEEFVQNSDKMSEIGLEKQSTTCQEKTTMVDTIDTNLGLKRYMSTSDSLKYEKGRPDLRRTVMESWRKSKDSGEKDNLFVEDALSNEEFKCAVEAFIAKQKKFLREEEDSPTLAIESRLSRTIYQSCLKT